MKPLLLFLTIFGLIGFAADLEFIQSDGTKVQRAQSGDVTYNVATGASTIGATKVTNSMLAGSIAASKLIGTDIASLGTVTAGTWNATAIAAQYGGTGINGSAAANGKLAIGNGSGYSLANITGTANQVVVTNGAGTIALSGPQDLATGSSPTFAGGTINGVLGGTWQTFTRGTGTVTVATTAYVDITGLSAAIGANETWVYHIMVPITGATNGCKFQVTGPASPTAVQIYYEANLTSLSGAQAIEPVTAFSTPTATAVHASAVTGYSRFEILVVNGSNAGTVQLQFATALGTNTITALANRYIEGTRKN